MRLPRLLAALTALLLLSAPASAYTREEVRARYQAINDWTEGGLFAEEPSVSAPYAAGEVRQDALEDALSYLNFLRDLAGLAPVELDPALTSIAQQGAVLSAANGFVSHDPPAPADMDAAFAGAARYAASSCNIARLNWTSEDVLRQGILYFARDDGEANLSTLGHRRWLLNPNMAYTGFGLAMDEAGMSYITMYAHDLQADPGDWQYIAWPSAGAFPAELMSKELAWSIILDPDLYDTDGAWVRLTDLNSGEVYEFPGDGGYFAVDAGGYGAGPCLIFRPELTKDYEQNQRWRVEAGASSGPDIAFEVEMISLYPVEPSSVEIAPREATLRPGETLKLSAAVIPEWADDLSIIWSSGDERVATVENGFVTAVSAGECEIIATSVNGKYDVCRLTVAE